MGDPDEPETTPYLWLPPGCRLFPSEEQLLGYYLTNKNCLSTNLSYNSNLYNCNVIRELDLRNFAPYALPDSACFAYGYRGRKRHWYCYVNKARVLMQPNRRLANGGFWRRSGISRDVTRRGGKVVCGTRTKFVFYLGNSEKDAIKTEWIMYEYALLDHDNVKASFVLCRIFAKSHRGNSTSDNALSSCAEENVSAVRDIGVQYEENDSTVRDIGIQCDEFSTPDTIDAKVDQNSVDEKNDIANFQLPLGINGIPLVGTHGLAGSNMFLEAVPDQQLLSILKEDFIELDDLLD